MTQLPTPTTSPGDVDTWVADHLIRLSCETTVQRSARFVGTQTAADAASAGLDIGGYRSRRNEVLPAQRRGATALSPYIRHGLLTLPRVYDAVDDAPSGDRRTFRDELLWQEYARHVYA